MTKTTVFGIAFDAHDAAKVAQFWADTLGRQVADGADADDAVVLPSDLVSAGYSIKSPKARPSRTACTSISPPATSTAKRRG